MSGSKEVVGAASLRAHLTDRVIDDIAASSHDQRLTALFGTRVGPGFRARIRALLPEEVEQASLLHLLLDDWTGASLVSGYALQHAAILSGTQEKLPLGVVDSLSGICAGFASDAAVIAYARDHDTIPSVRGPIAPCLHAEDADGMHAVEPLGAHGMRRLRRMDVYSLNTASVAFDCHFRDSHVDQDGAETIVHEYTVDGAVEVATRTITSITATVRVLPWQECPAAISSAARVRGTTLVQLRRRISNEFVGTSTCTHLNDTLRTLGDLGALMAVGERQDQW